MTRLDHLLDLAARAQALRARARRDTSPAAVVDTPRGDGSWYRIAAAAASSTPVYLYDIIGTFGVTAGQFVADLAGIKTPAIDLHINSPGGDVFDGIAIHAALVNHPAAVHTIVDGLAASAASFVAMAGDQRSIEKPATMMIHDAWGMAIGNASDMRSMADLLDMTSDTIAGIYADRAGGTVTSWRDAMRNETWYTAPQAIAAGLADQVLNANEPAPEDRRTQLIRARARVTLKG